MNNDDAFDSLLFNGFEPIWHTLLIGTVGYVALVVILRASGKRTLSRMDAFDTIIAVAIGATFARSLTARDVALADALIAFVLLAMLQRLLAWLKVRSCTARRLLDAEPTLLFFGGDFLDDVLQQTGFTYGDLIEATRQHGIGSMDQVGAIVLELDGKLSVISKSQLSDKGSSTLQGLTAPGD